MLHGYPTHAKCSVRTLISIDGKWEPPWKLDAAALGTQVRYARVADDDGKEWRGSRHRGAQKGVFWGPGIKTELQDTLRGPPAAP